MGGHTPKPGDRCKLRFTSWIDATIDRVDETCISYHHTCNPMAFGSAVHSAVDLELIQAAPVPFVVGQPITPEMGEPPLYSVVGHPNGPLCWQRVRKGWMAADGRDGMAWEDFERAGAPMILLRLGDGSVTS